jgi:tetratricopeptide (TPR) repeat protein
MSELPTIDAERPWPGLLPFTEDSRMFFHGRESETDDLFRLIERDPLTVLFGQSGLGKSSLLNAGVFPRLRRAGYLPVYLRLNLDPAAPVLIGQVWQALIDECVYHEVSASPILQGDGFWQYLHRPGTQFLNPHGRPVLPVLAFDQFEELFTLGRQTPKQAARTELLLQQLGELIENRLPPALESELTNHPELLDRFDLLRQNIKMVFTFREDYLAEFEGLKALIRPIMQNRMRLTPMRGDRAAEAIQQAGSGHLSEAVAARIVRFVGGATRSDTGRLEEISIEPALLSLVCRELNEQRIARGQAEISADLIQGENTQQIIAQFYSQGFAGLDIKVRHFVEDRLLTSAGYRDSCALDNALAEPGVSEAAIQSLVDRRILRREERGGLVRLELIHDVLAMVAKASRAARREAESLEAAQLLLAKHRRRQRIAGAWAAVLVMVLLAVSWLAVFAMRGRKEAVSAELKAVSAQQQADQQAMRAIEQKEVAQSEEAHAKFETSRANLAERLAKLRQGQLEASVEEARLATDKATSEAAEKEKQRWRAVEWSAAADEQLDAHGTGEQLRACVESTDRLADDPAPPASLDYMVGVWHVDQGSSSSDMDWHSDGICVNRHVYLNGHELDMKDDICTWKYKPIAEHEFEIDYQSKMRESDPNQLIFKITSPTRIHSTNLNYDAFRIICPARELTIRRGELVTLQKQVDEDPNNLAHQMDLASGLDKLGVALAAQGDLAKAVMEFDNELDVYQKLALRDPGNLTWQRSVAQLFERIGDDQLAESRAFNQAGDGPRTVSQAKAALASYQKSLAIREQLLHATPVDVDAQHSAAHASEQLGVALFWLNQRAEAANAFRESVRLLQYLTDKHQGSSRISADLALSLINLSRASDAAEPKKEALQRALAIAIKLDHGHELPDEMVGAVAFLQGEIAKLH